MSRIQEYSERQSFFSLPIASLALGVLFIVASFFPIGNAASQSLWTEEDSATYDRVSVEYKRFVYKTAARSGLSEEEWEAQREKMKQQMEAMNEELARAQEQPGVWSRWLLWSGAALVTIGAVGFYWQHADQ